MSLLTKVIRKATGTPLSAAVSPESARALHYFFVGGHPRSGTNWVSALLNLHPDIFCDGEFHFQILRQAFNGFSSLPWYLASRDPVRAVAEEALADLIRRCLAAQAMSGAHREGKPEAIVVGDHTPRMVTTLIPPPEGKYINIVRDGRDVLVSWTFHLLRTGKAEIVQAPVRPLLSRELAALPTVDATSDPANSISGANEGMNVPRPGSRGAALTASVRRLLQEPAWVHHYAAGWAMHVQHDDQALKGIESISLFAASASGNGHHGASQCSTASWGDGGSVLRLRYEQLHTDIQGQRARLYRFLGVEPERAAEISAGSKTSPGFGRESPSAFYRKGEVGDWKNYFTDVTTTYFKDAAGASLVGLGYERDHSW